MSAAYTQADGLTDLVSSGLVGKYKAVHLSLTRPIMLAKIAFQRNSIIKCIKSLVSGVLRACNKLLLFITIRIILLSLWF